MNSHTCTPAQLFHEESKRIAGGAPSAFMKPIPSLMNCYLNSPFQFPAKTALKRCIYWSDFDLSCEDWKAEAEKIELFSNCLQASFGSSAQMEATLSTIFRQPSSLPAKPLFEVAIEYALLTGRILAKTPEQRKQEFAAYASYYGYSLVNDPALDAFISSLLAACQEGIKKVDALHELNRAYTVDHRQKTFESISQHRSLKTFYYTLLLQNRFISPLKASSQKFVESLPGELLNSLSSPEAESKETIEKKMENLRIEEHLPDLDAPRIHSQSMRVKRCFNEVQKGTFDEGLSDDVMAGIVAYVDLEERKRKEEEMKCVTNGNLVFTVMELNADDLKAVLSKLSPPSLNENMITLKILKPCKFFYNTLISLCLRYGMNELSTVNETDFLEAAVHLLGPIYKPSLEEPCKFFFGLCKTEASKDTNPDLATALKEIMGKLMAEWSGTVIGKIKPTKKMKMEE